MSVRFLETVEKSKIIALKLTKSVLRPWINIYLNCSFILTNDINDNLKNPIF